eukprot:154851-Ditylum_brightwellii.AAC.1
MESTWITQEDAKENETASSAGNVVVNNKKDKKEETAQTDAIHGTNNNINWKLMLGHCTNEVLTKTWEHTMQYFPHQAKSENQSYPTQHCQK